MQVVSQSGCRSKIYVRQEYSAVIIKAFRDKDLSGPNVAYQIANVGDDKEEKDDHSFFKPRGFLLVALCYVPYVVPEKEKQGRNEILRSDAVGIRILNVKIKQQEQRDVYRNKIPVE